MKYWTSLIGASLIVGLIGCDSVTLDGPVGERITEAEASAFVGRWTAGESEVIEFRLNSTGKLSAGTLRWDDEQQKHVAVNNEINVRRVGKVMYFQFSNDKEIFGFVRIEQTGDQEFKMYSPDSKAFRTAVEEGKLDGMVTSRENDHFDVLIRADSPLTTSVFSAGNRGDWYDEEMAQTFHCIKRFDTKK